MSERKCLYNNNLVLFISCGKIGNEQLIKPLFHELDLR